MGALQLVTGKFLKDGIVIPVEFGNYEQIRLLKKAEEDAKAIIEGVELYYSTEIVEVSYTASYKCACGGLVRFSEESDEQDNPECLSELTRNCHKCKQYYETYLDGYTLMIKKV